MRPECGGEWVQGVQLLLPSSAAQAAGQPVWLVQAAGAAMHCVLQHSRAVVSCRPTLHESQGPGVPL